MTMIGMQSKSMNDGIELNGLIGQSKAGQILNGSLLPNSDKKCFLQLNDATTVVVFDFQGLHIDSVIIAKREKVSGRQPVALASILRYSPTQAYCLLAQVDENIRQKAVQMESLTNMWRGIGEQSLKIAKIKAKLPDRSQRPIYVQTHICPKTRYTLEHVMDAVIEQSLGVHNLELKKNVTVDLYDSTELDVWRDRVGFCVSDRRQYTELHVSRVVMRQKLLARGGVGEVVQCAPADMRQLLDYDQIVCQVDRADYLSFLVGLQDVRAIGAYQNGLMVGYILSTIDTIMQCYADSEEVCAALLLNVVALERDDQRPISLHTVCRGWLAALLQPASLSHRLIQRFHTRSVPGQIDLSKVFILNIGMHVI